MVVVAAGMSGAAAAATLAAAGRAVRGSSSGRQQQQQGHHPFPNAVPGQKNPLPAPARRDRGKPQGDHPAKRKKGKQGPDLPLGQAQFAEEEQKDRAAKVERRAEQDTEMGSDSK